MSFIRKKREAKLTMLQGLRASMCKAVSTAIAAFCLLLVSTTLVLFGTGLSQAGSTDVSSIKEGTMNRLAKEKSPYLQKHAANPVDWYPWGDEAFEKAKKEDKPIFLSIGYSTCHWCNVMEEESFNNPEEAALMNEVFVSIKVDREERPDIDSVYMSVSMLLTGSGGWPLTIVMTPDKKPFYAATYIPRNSRFGRPGMMDFIPSVRDVWKERRQAIEDSADKIVAALGGRGVASNAGELASEDIATAHELFKDSFDTVSGGFNTAPKFPTPHILTFLLRVHKRTGEQAPLNMALKTLRHMRAGGIYHHLGYGFHRYSTDARWLVPHFEKMLYDQALLAIAYIEAYQASGEVEFASVAKEIFTYVLRDMRSTDGAFYSAEDADSEGEEGKFYMWSEGEVKAALSVREAEIALRVFNTMPEGNFTDPLEEGPDGRNILHLSPDTASKLKVKESDLENIREKLFKLRQKRVHPFKDKKILTDWNALMIVALAKAARAFDDKAYEEAAKGAAEFLLKEMRPEKGRLLHLWLDGPSELRAGAEDYAYLTWALTELYETTFDTRYLETALELTDEFVDQFWDDERGGFYLTSDSGEKLITRPKEVYDGALPSYNSVAMLALLKLSRLTGNTGHEDRAMSISKAFAAEVKSNPVAYTMLLSALDFGIGPTQEVVIVGTPGKRDTVAMLKALRGEFAPSKVTVFVPEDGKTAAITKLVKFTEWMVMKDGKATAYVCTNFICKSPTTDVNKMIEYLN